MLATINKLQRYIEDPAINPHILHKRCSAAHEIPDYLSNRFALLTEDTNPGVPIEVEGDVTSGELSGEDLGVNW